MKTLKDYLFEGFFDTPDDALPIYDLVKNWFEENVPYEHLGKTYDIEIKNNKTLIIPKKKSKYNKQFFFKKPLPDYIKFDTKNWIQNSICAVLEYSGGLFDTTFINDQKEIDKFPRIYKLYTELSDLHINVNDYCNIYGGNQLVKKFEINLNNNKYHDALLIIGGVKINDFADINIINKNILLDLRFDLKSIQGKCKKFCDDIKIYSKTHSYDTEIDNKFISEHQETFDWLNTCNVKHFTMVVNNKSQFLISRAAKNHWKLKF